MTSNCNFCSHSEVCSKQEVFKEILKDITIINSDLKEIGETCDWVNVEIVCKHFNFVIKPIDCSIEAVPLKEKKKFTDYFKF